MYKQELHSTTRISTMLTLKTVYYEPWKLVTGIQKRYHDKYESARSSSSKPQSNLNYELCGLYSGLLSSN
jgi:hypothetical protein